MIISDCHLHTRFSGDSETPVHKTIEQAIALGLKTICITDHFDYDYPSIYGIDFNLDVPTYVNRLAELKESYKYQIELLTGIELGLDPDINDLYPKFLASHGFDFIIGSTHLVDKMDPYFPGYFEKHEKVEGIRHYYDTILKNIATCADFDVCGHIDYLIRYAPNQNKDLNLLDYMDIIDQILIAVIQKGKGIEINTAGFKYGLNHPHPHPDIVKRYKELGGEIVTIGSDGHTPETMAFDFQKVPEFLKSAGYEYYTIYKNRKPVQIKL